MITQPHNTTGCVGGTAMFTCVVHVTVDLSTNNIKWWRKRIDNNSPSDEIRTQGNNVWNITNSISGEMLTSVLMITGLTSVHIGPYWLEVADGTQLIMSDMAFFSIILSGTYVCISAYVDMTCVRTYV